MNKALVCVTIIFLANQAMSEDLGAIGKTYPIGEQNLMDYIKSRATTLVDNGQWENLRKKAVANTENKIDHPPVIAGIYPTVESSIRYYDPAVKINQDIINPYDKSIIARKGQIVNPTTYMAFNNELIFIDGRDQNQVEYALAESKRSPYQSSIILIAANNFRDLLKEKQHLFFYDQGASLTKKFNIRHVPTIIYQDQVKPTKLRIEEVKL